MGTCSNAPGQDVFSAWEQARQRHPAGYGTAKARRPGVPDGSILPRNPCVSPRERQLGLSPSAITPKPRSHRPGLTPLTCEPLSLSTHCLLPLALSQAPAACECANLTKFQDCGWWMHIATHRPCRSASIFQLRCAERVGRRQVRGRPQAHAAKPMFDAPCCRSSNHGCCWAPSPPFTLLNFCC